MIQVQSQLPFHRDPLFRRKVRWKCVVRLFFWVYLPVTQVSDCDEGLVCQDSWFNFPVRIGLVQRIYEWERTSMGLRCDSQMNFN